MINDLKPPWNLADDIQVNEVEYRFWLGLNQGHKFEVCLKKGPVKLGLNVPNMVSGVLDCSSMLRPNSGMIKLFKNPYYPSAHEPILRLIY